MNRKKLIVNGATARSHDQVDSEHADKTVTLKLGRGGRVIQATVSELRENLSGYLSSGNPISVTNRGREAGYWLPAAFTVQDEDDQGEAQKRAYEQATAQIRAIKSMMDPDDASEAIQEIEDLRDAEGYIE